jgi:hypothetical protein
MAHSQRIVLGTLGKTEFAALLEGRGKDEGLRRFAKERELEDPAYYITLTPLPRE